jgi:hypothetical protein
MCDADRDAVVGHNAPGKRTRRGRCCRAGRQEHVGRDARVGVLNDLSYAYHCRDCWKCPGFYGRENEQGSWRRRRRWCSPGTAGPRRASFYRKAATQVILLYICGLGAAPRFCDEAQRLCALLHHIFHKFFVVEHIASTASRTYVTCGAPSETRPRRHLSQQRHRAVFGFLNVLSALTFIGRNPPTRARHVEDVLHTRSQQSASPKPFLVGVGEPARIVDGGGYLGMPGRVHGC